MTPASPPAAPPVGPPALGRGVVVPAGDPVPDPWAGVPVVTIDAAAVDDPSTVVPVLHEAWSNRRPVVVALAVDPGDFRSPRTWSDPPHALDPDLEPWHDRLHFLVWTNNVDARSGEPTWWWAVKAGRLGAEPTPDGPADVRLPDGRAAWIDGGPRQPIAPDDEGGAGGAVVVHAETVDAASLQPLPAPVAPSAELAPDQLAAVAHRSGPARVLAPAGSGKTRVLTERLRHLVVDRGYEPGGVVAVAYNVKARDELVERTAGFQPRVQTLNGLAYALLRDHRGQAPTVVEEREVRRIVEGLAPRKRPRANTDPLAAYLEGLTAVRLGLRDPSEVEDERGDVPGLADLFEPYRAELRRRGAVDFDEQVYAAVEALLTDGPFRRRAQARHRHLLVDEFQDLTPAHVLLVRLLAAPAFDVFGVGDDDQVIYGHAGADPAFLVDVDRYLPGAGTHELEVNYRCPVAVVDGARHLLGYNRRRVVKVMRPGPSALPGPGALAVVRHDADGGATELVDQVRDWLAEPGAEPGQVAVLARVRSLLLAPHVALTEAGVPVQSILTTDVLGRTGVRAALAYLRIAVDPGGVRGEDLAEVYRRPSRGLPNWITKWFARAGSVEGVHRIVDRLDDERAAAKVADLAADLDLLAALAESGADARALLTAVRDQVGLGSAMEQLDRSKGGEGSSQLDDLEALRQVASLHPDPADFEPWLRSVFHRATDAGGVTLSTVHRVKGREWDRVAVFGATNGLLPHRLAGDVEEERRVLHVAITRARRAAVVYADRTAPSPFLAELDGSAPEPARLPTTAGGGVAASRPGRAGTRGTAADPEPGSLGAALREWRLERSRTDEVPAYVVASNATLDAIVDAEPTSEAALARVPGIGPAKLERYADDILAIVRHAREHG